MTTKRRIIKLVFYGLLSALTLFQPGKLAAQTGEKGASGLPIPRFVSLKAKRVNMRVGPGQNYQVVWLYTKSGVPMEVIQEFDNWRRVRDFDGTEGWIFHSLLSGARTAVVAPWLRDQSPTILTSVFTSQSEISKIKAKLEPGVIVDVETCDGQWCDIRIQNVRGWIEQDKLWGVYPEEAFK